MSNELQQAAWQHRDLDGDAEMIDWREISESYPLATVLTEPPRVNWLVVIARFVAFVATVYGLTWLIFGGF